MVDRDGRPVPPGAYGERLLVTVLGSRTLPLIRYELDDSVRLAAAPCPCGRPYALVDGVQGKRQEVLLLPGAAGTPVPVNPVVFHRLLDAQPVEGWQVALRRDGLVVRVHRPGAGFDGGALAAAARAELRTLGAADLHLALEVVDAIPRGTTGKVALVVSEQGA